MCVLRKVKTSDGFTLAEVVVAAGLLASVWIISASLQVQSLAYSEGALAQQALLGTHADLAMQGERPAKGAKLSGGIWTLTYSQRHAPLSELMLWGR